MALGATCVQRFDGSRDSAIHTTYRISLRSSSMREPRYPLPGVVRTFPSFRGHRRRRVAGTRGRRSRQCSLARAAPGGFVGTDRCRGGGGASNRPHRWCGPGRPLSRPLRQADGGGVRGQPFAGVPGLGGYDNDPSAGSPTETLLRLLLPLNDKVQWTSRDVAGGEPPASPRSEHFTGPFNR